MAISYNKLFSVLALKGVGKTWLSKTVGLSATTVAKLSRGEHITTETVERICLALDVQPGDIMSVIPDEKK